MSNIRALTVLYDGNADVLYVSRNREAATTGKEDKYGVVWRYDREGKLIGATITDFFESWSDDLDLLVERLAKRFDVPEPQTRVMLDHALSLHDERDA